jgi:Ca2+-binding EF-hand superfamily protein
VIEAFKYFDKGKDGYITVEEFQSAMASMGQTISIEEIKKLMDEIKLESHSYINYSDFIAAALNQDVFSSHEKLWSAFKHFDVHDKNFITAKDLMEAMARVGKKISSEEAEKMFKECKLGEKIGYEDFVKVMKFNTQDSPTTKSLIQDKSGSSSKFFI